MGNDTGVYLNDFSDFDDVMNNYNVTNEERAFIKRIILADYTYEDYSGSAYVLFEGIDGKLYEVYGSHCSCYGLEDQWSIEETTVEAFQELIDRGVNNVDWNGVLIADILKLLK